MGCADRDAPRRALSKPAAFVVLRKGLALKTELTAERLRELLHYDPETGFFTWTQDNGRHRAGERAEHKTAQDYRGITIDGTSYLAHRLAWLYALGDWPSLDVDHRDGNRANNSFLNLREASDSENAQNRAIRSDNSSGFPGVSWHKRAQAWQSKIGINGRRMFLGIFETPEEASAAYLLAKERHHSFQPFHRLGAVPGLTKALSVASSA